jgi:plastocyanin
MRFSGIYYYYDPPDPKIEPGECIGWQASSQTHSSTGSGCSADPLCGSPAPAACQWDTANVVGGSATPTSTCFYDPSLYPAATADDFHCRVHTAMLGTIQVTPPIQLSVAKDLATSSVMLTWSGGGVIDDVSYKVERQSGGDPRFPVASTVTADPDAGSLDTTFTDAGDLTDPTTRYYLVRNKQSNEP